MSHQMVGMAPRISPLICFGGDQPRLTRVKVPGFLGPELWGLSWAGSSVWLLCAGSLGWLRSGTW